jgi:hypothetical protein
MAEGFVCRFILDIAGPNWHETLMERVETLPFPPVAGMLVEGLFDDQDDDYLPFTIGLVCWNIKAGRFEVHSKMSKGRYESDLKVQECMDAYRKVGWEIAADLTDP